MTLSIRATEALTEPLDAGRDGPFVQSLDRRLPTQMRAIDRLRDRDGNVAVRSPMWHGIRTADLTAMLPSGPGFIGLLASFRATGGTVPGNIACRLLEDHSARPAVSLAKLIHTGQAFGFEWRAHLWIPIFQFDADDWSLKASVQAVRAALPDRWTGWTVATWFAASNAQLQGRRPANEIDADPAAVLRAAQALNWSEFRN